MFICIQLTSRNLFLCKVPEDKFEDDTHDTDGLVTEGSRSVKDEVSINLYSQ